MALDISSISKLGTAKSRRPDVTAYNCPVSIPSFPRQWLETLMMLVLNLSTFCNQQETFSVTYHGNPMSTRPLTDPLSIAALSESRQ
jgi:hypothetical protein